MILIEDPIFENIKGAYGSYNPIPKLKRLEENSDNEEIRKEILNEFLENLYHQGSIYLVSFLTVPLLIRLALKNKLFDGKIIYLVGILEIARQEQSFQIPQKYLSDYESEIKNVTLLAHFNKNWDYNFTLISTMAIAAVNGQTDFAEFIHHSYGIDTKLLRVISKNEEIFEEIMKQKGLINTTIKDKRQLRLF